MNLIQIKPSSIAHVLLCPVLLFMFSCKQPDTHNCVHNNLSKDFSFEVNATHFLMEDGVQDSLDVFIKITNKHTKTEKELHFGNGWMFEGTYTDCNRVRSYTTHVNEDAQIADNDYGDIVVADLNFDGKDDFVLKKNSGGNTGPDYAFYLQDKKGGFAEDRFLTDSVGYFPDDIDVSKKQITVSTTSFLVVGERIFSYNTDTQKWQKKRHTIWHDFEYTKLSKAFNLTITTSKIPQPDEQDSVYIAVAVMDKKGTLQQEIKFGSDFFELPFTDGTDARSYITGFNKDAEVMDKDHGNLVVADFNFDGKDDLAIKCEQGGNGGPKYKYYVQEAKGLFAEDKFLGDLGYFPATFIATDKTLIFKIRLNAAEDEFITCRYTTAIHKWRVVKTETRTY